MSDKRKDYLSWDEYFMGVAILAGMRSKDPNTQVGACIVSQSNRILSVGYNGFPNGVSDDEFPWNPSKTNIFTRPTVSSTRSSITGAVRWKGPKCM